MWQTRNGLEKSGEKKRGRHRAKRKVKRGGGGGGGASELCDVKEHRFSGSRRRVFDIEMGRNSPFLHALPMSAAFYLGEEHVVSNATARRWRRRRRRMSRRALATTLSTLQRCRAPGDSQTVPSCVPLSFPPSRTHPSPASGRLHGGWPRVSSVIRRGRFPRVIYYRLAIPLRE